MVLGKFHTAVERGARSCGQGPLACPPRPAQPPGARVPHTRSPPWGRATPTGTAQPPGCWCRVPAAHEQPEIPGGQGLGGSRAPRGAPARGRGPHRATTQLPRHQAGQDPSAPRASAWWSQALRPPTALPAARSPCTAGRGAGPRCLRHAPTASSTGGESAGRRALPAAAQAAPGRAAVSPAAISGAGASGGSAGALGGSSPALAAGPAARCTGDCPLQACTPPAAPSGTLPTTLHYKTLPLKPNPPAHVLGGAVPPDSHSSSRTPWMDTHTLLAPGLPAAPGALSCLGTPPAILPSASTSPGPSSLLGQLLPAPAPTRPGFLAGRSPEPPAAPQAPCGAQPSLGAAAGSAGRGRGKRPLQKREEARGGAAQGEVPACTGAAAGRPSRGCCREQGCWGVTAAHAERGSRAPSRSWGKEWGWLCAAWCRCWGGGSCAPAARLQPLAQRGGTDPVPGTGEALPQHPCPDAWTLGSPSAPSTNDAQPPGALSPQPTPSPALQPPPAPHLFLHPMASQHQHHGDLTPASRPAHRRCPTQQGTAHPQPPVPQSLHSPTPYFSSLVGSHGAMAGSAAQCGDPGPCVGQLPVPPAALPGSRAPHRLVQTSASSTPSWVLWDPADGPAPCQGTGHGAHCPHAARPGTGAARGAMGLPGVRWGCLAQPCCSAQSPPAERCPEQGCRGWSLWR